MTWSYLGRPWQNMRRDWWKFWTDFKKRDNLSISLDKCQFCQTKVKYVGHIVTTDSVAADPAKVEAVTNWPKPSNLKTWHSFLGFCRYYQWFNRNYSSIVHPFTDLHWPQQKDKRKEWCLSWREGAIWWQKGWILHGCFWENKRLFDKCSSVSLCWSWSTIHTVHGFQPLRTCSCFISRASRRVEASCICKQKLSSSEKNQAIHQLQCLSLKWRLPKNSTIISMGPILQTFNLCPYISKTQCCGASVTIRFVSVWFWHYLQTGHK